MIGYKPILPSSLLKERVSDMFSFNNKVFTNFSLRVGVVLEVIEPDDDANTHKNIPQYNVMTIEQHGQGAMNTTIYKNCVFNDAFGGVADYMQYRLRAPEDPDKVKNSGSLKEQVGSIVLLLCADGNAEKAVIISCFGHPDRDPILTKDKEHHLEGEFNGFNWQVNKDGEATVTFKSKTSAAGEYDDEEAGGTYIKFDKEGSIEIATGNDETISINKKDKTISVKSGDAFSVEAGGDMTLKSDGAVNISSAKDLIAEATGKAGFSANSGFDIQCKGAITVKGAKLEIKADAMIQMEAPITQIKGNVVQIGPSPSPAVVLSTQFMGIGNNGAPVISNAIGPFSASVFISS